MYSVCVQRSRHARSCLDSPSVSLTLTESYFSRNNPEMRLFPYASNIYVVQGCCNSFKAISRRRMAGISDKISPIR